MIKFIDVKKKIGDSFNFEIKNLEINENEIIGLAGNNGAGKTTMLNLLLDLIKIDSGNIQSFKVNVSKSEKWKAFTGAFLDESFLVPYLKPREYFELIAQLKNHTNNTLANLKNLLHGLISDEILNSNKYIRELSKGNKQKIGIAGALIGSPKVIIFDEPFANLDPSAQNFLKLILKNLPNKEKRIVLVSSHNLLHFKDIFTRILIIDNGQIVSDKPNGETTFNELQSYFNV